MIKNIFQWFVYSSADPSKISLTLKGIFAGLVTIVTIYGGLAHIDVSTITSTNFSAITDSAILAIQSIAAIASFLVIVFAFGRKVYYTFFPK